MLITACYNITKYTLICIYTHSSDSLSITGEDKIMYSSLCPAVNQCQVKMNDAPGPAAIMQTPTVASQVAFWLGI